MRQVELHLPTSTLNKTVASGSDMWLRSAAVPKHGEHRRRAQRAAQQLCFGV
jgi:hypothetical protein